MWTTPGTGPVNRARAGGRVDGSADFPGPGARSWHPNRAIPLVAGLITMGAVTWGLSSTGTDRLFAAGVTLGGALVVLLATRRRVIAGPAGIAVQGLTGTRRWLWSDLEAIALATQQRLGLTTTTLELDLGDDIVVLGKVDLDDDPTAVHDVLLRWYQA